MKKFLLAILIGLILLPSFAVAESTSTDLDSKSRLHGAVYFLHTVAITNWGIWFDSISLGKGYGDMIVSTAKLIDITVYPLPSDVKSATEMADTVAKYYKTAQEKSDQSSSEYVEACFDFGYFMGACRIGFHACTTLYNEEDKVIDNTKTSTISVLKQVRRLADVLKVPQKSKDDLDNVIKAYGSVTYNKDIPPIAKSMSSIEKDMVKFLSVK